MPTIETGFGNEFRADFTSPESPPINSVTFYVGWSYGDTPGNVVLDNMEELTELLRDFVRDKLSDNTIDLTYLVRNGNATERYVP
jgi:hypothetical protein